MNTQRIHTTSQEDTQEYTSQTPPIQQPAALMAHYVCEQKLGQGSQGQVWLAKRKNDGEHVAIKQLNIHSVTTWKQYELFQREANILANLNIEGVAPFYEYIEDLNAKPPFVCIVQKYIEGKTLAEMLKAKHRFKTETIYDIIAQTLRILQTLHTYRPPIIHRVIKPDGKRCPSQADYRPPIIPIIHRDIKPSNLMLTPIGDEQYKVTLLDFGAIANPQVQNGGSTVAGTFGYMPPEQLMGQSQPASDIYALAAVAVELLSGISPADIPVCDFKLVIEPYLSHIPPHVVDTLKAMLEPALSDRLCHHSELIAQFDALAKKKEPSMLDWIRQTKVPKLRDVEYICQPGNYEIWQNLEQETKINFTHCSCNLDVHRPEATAAKEFRNNINDKRTMMLNAIGFAIGFVLSFAVCLFTTAIQIAYNNLSLPIREYITFCFVVIYIILFIIFKIHFHLQITRENNLEAKLSSFKPCQNINGSNWEVMQKLVKGGQKVVGRITKIEYLGSHPHYSYFAHHTKLGKIDYSKESINPNDLPVTFDIPKFKVIYQFKYTISPEEILELQGELITHTQPENHFKVGDPITLVANISIDSKISLSVAPYPYPYGDILNIEEILYTETFELNA